MNGLIDSVAVWLADYLLLATVLLALVLAALAALAQPVRRLVVVKSTLAALALVAVLCAVPGWSVVHLMTAAERDAAAGGWGRSPADSPLVELAGWGRGGAEPADRNETGGTRSLDPSHPAPQPIVNQATTSWSWSELPWPTIAVSSYAAGSTIVLLWLAIGAMAARRLVRRADAANSDLFNVFNEVTDPTARPPQLLDSDQIDTAIALGVFQPIVILPRAWTDRISLPVREGQGEGSPVVDDSHADLRSVLVHEWTHINNGDLQWLAASRALFVLLWAHPLYWLLRRRMRLDQEALADAAAADTTGRKSYAAQLVSWARSAAAHPRMPVAASVGLWEGPSQLRRRIALLLDERFTVLRSCSRGWRVSATIGLIAAAVALSLVTVQPRSVAQTESYSASQSPTIESAADQAVATNGIGTASELAGRVIDEQGQPLANVVVDAWTWVPGTETRTDANGRFSLGGFEPNQSVQVEFRLDGYVPALFTNQKAGTRDWTITLNNHTYLEGKVLGPDSRPVPFALVRAMRGPFTTDDGSVIGEVWTEVSANSEGEYRLYLEPDTYDVQLRVPAVGIARHQGTTVAAGEKRKLDIQLQPGPTFRATILDGQTNEPVEGIRLWYWMKPGIEGTSNDAGVVTIENVPPGEFEFNVAAAGAPPSEVAGDYARWWSPDAVHEQQRLQRRDGDATFQRNLDDLTFDIVDNFNPVRILLEKAVTITGRVIDPEGQPVAGATVAPAKTGTANSITGDTRYSVLTTADGTFTMRLPASGRAKYNLVAHDGKYREWRKWANGVGNVIQTQPGQKLENVVLSLTRPAVIRGQVIDEAGKPLASQTVRAQAADKLENRYYDPETKTNEMGEFELPFVRAGEQIVQVGNVYANTDADPSLAWIVVTADPEKPIEDIVLTPETPPTPGQQLRERLRANIRDMRPADDAAAPSGEQAAERPPDESTRVFDDIDAPETPTSQGNNLLRDIRLAAAPILARMAEEHGYGLAPGQNVRRVAPPFAPIRMEYYGVGHPTQAEAIPAGPGAMVFHWIDGRPKNWGMTFGDPDNPGYSLKDALNALAGIKSQHIEGPDDLLNQRLPGDWVIRPGVNDTEIIKQLQAILQIELAFPIKLEFREVKRPVYVARGEYNLTPLPGYSGEDETHYENETVKSDAIEIFGKHLVPDSGGGGTGDFNQFLLWLGRWIGTPIASEVTVLPKRQLSWSQHGRSPFTAQMYAEDHDPQLVLANITAQTGLTFTKENRPVRILFVERSE